MSNELSVLVLEDNPSDAELEIAALEDAGYPCRWDRVDNRRDFLTQLKAKHFDLILADFRLPSFDGMTALKLVRERYIDAPFIFISGIMGEEMAIEALKAGATDYVSKGRLSRLVPVVQRALREKEEKRQREQAEQALRESEKRYRTLFEMAGDAIFILAAEGQGAGTILSANQAAADLYGYTVSELLTMNIGDLDPPETAKGIFDRMPWLVEGEWIIEEITHRKKDGALFPVEISAGRLDFGTARVVFAFYRDITERKKSEQALLESEERYRAVVEGLPILIFRFRPDGTLTFMNRAYSTFLEKDHQTATGRNIFELLPEAEQKRIRIHLFSLDPHKPDKSYEQEIIAPNGETLWFEWNDRALFDLQGQVIEYQSIGRNITEGKKALQDRERMEKLLQEAQKLEAIGTLAGGIAHDFNNILSAIIGYAGLMQLAEIPQDSPLGPYLDGILRAGDRAKDLVSQILTFSQDNEKEKRPVQLSFIIKEVVKFLRASLPSTIKIHQDLNKETSTILANSTQMHQVLMNLCTNAAQAMRDQGGSLDVVLTEVNLDAQDAALHPELKTGPYVKLTVRDTGHGMSPEILGRIFEPYFTTKAKGEGTGLGLAVTHGIVKNHDGAIYARSELGKGSTFEVYFPVYEPGGFEIRPVSVEPLPQGTEHVLFVDDELPLLEIGKKILKRLGYEVDVRTSSLEALEAFRTRPQDYDLVITDLTMPNMTGDRLAREILAIRADMPIILCTGFSQVISPDQAKAMGIREMVMKPLTVRNLAETVRRVLDRKG
jgi:PAS domain S-box-containing protein